MVFLAFIFIFALGFFILGRRINTSTAKKTKKERKERKGIITREQKLSKQVRSGQMANVFIASVGLGISYFNTRFCVVPL